MNNTIIIFGGDGYIGWPLAMKLAVQHPDHKIIILDNEWRRNTVVKSGAQSLVPIASPAERIAAFEALYGLNNILYLKGEIESNITESLIKTEQPHTIYHLAHQPSGPYSMKGVEEAIFTLKNNEAGNMRLMWAVMQHAPEAHIVKLGSIGQFAHNGIDIPEGYYLPEHNNRKANKETLFHREAEDIYHISKMNDTNYILMACRKWGLRITDVMQSTVFGVRTEEMMDCESLYTRFDYDHIFGTVLNRFISQVVSHQPMTIYGTGHQRTGLMALNDTVNSLSGFVSNAPASGVHRVINHVSEKHFSINEIADIITDIAAKNGYNARISREFNPREELTATKQEYGIATHFLDETLNKTSFNTVVEETFKMVDHFKSRIDTRQFYPGIHWNPKERAKKDLTETESNLPGHQVSIIENEAYWEQFRNQNFPSVRINLNPGTLGTTSIHVINAKAGAIQKSELHAYPLGTYEEYHRQLDEITELCGKIWKAPGYEVCVTHSITQEMSLLSLSILRILQKKPKAQYTILTGTHEHYGGIGCFEQLPEFKIYYVADETLNDPEKLTAIVKEIQPDICFISHVFFDTGNLADIHGIYTIVKENYPECKIIADAAQSIGLYPIPAGDADIIVSSLHKWMFGPQGSGLMWVKNDFKNWLNGSPYFSAHQNNEQAIISASRNKGGLDFANYAAIGDALKLYYESFPENILKRSCYLAGILKSRVTNILEKNHIDFQLLNNSEHSPVITVGFTDYDPYQLYQYLNHHNIHIKCIKNHKIDNDFIHILRIGIPYYETIDRLLFVAGEIELFITQQVKAPAY